MRIFICFTIIFFQCVNCHAQQWQWAKKINQQHWKLKTAMDGLGNIYIAAQIHPNYSSKPIPVIYKLDSVGTLLTQHVFPKNLTISDIDVNSQNQIVIIGSCEDTLILGTSTFITKGSQDVFIGTFNSSFQLIWGKNYGHNFFSEGNALDIDNADNIYVCGGLSDSVNFEGTLLICNKGISSFVAKFNSGGQIQWVKKDSSDSKQNYSSATDILINSNNELLITGSYNNYGPLYFEFISFPVPANSIAYENYYALKTDLNGSAIWGKTSSRVYAADHLFKGFTSNYSLILHSYYSNGDDGTKLSLLNSLGNVYKKINVDSVFKGDIRTEYLGTIDNKIYLSSTKVYYNSMGKHSPTYIYTFKNDEIEIIDSLNGDIRNVSLLKKGSNEFYLTGIFDKMLIAGNDTLRTDSIGSYNNQIAYYANNPFIAKLNIATVTGISSVAPITNNFQVFPNPSSGIFTLDLKKQTAAKIKVYDVLGKCVFNHSYKNEDQIKIDLASQPEGIYFLEVEAEGIKEVRKIVIQ